MRGGSHSPWRKIEAMNLPVSRPKYLCENPRAAPQIQQPLASQQAASGTFNPSVGTLTVRPIQHR